MITDIDLHVHTSFSDGENTPEEMVQAAINLGLKTIGFSDHSYTEFDESWCMKKGASDKYKKKILLLKNKYKQKINILCGVEQDFYSTENTMGYDYVIGSVHYLKICDQYIPVDENKEILIDAANKYFNGDIIKVAELYYDTISNFAQQKCINIIGHFDIVTKFNENNKLFNEHDKRYVNAYKSAADKLLKANKTFEINTGAISRGYRTTPYPSKLIYNYINNNRGNFLLASDSHSKSNIAYQFKLWNDYYNSL